MARKETDKRITATVDIDTYNKLKYIAEQKGISISDLLKESLSFMLQYGSDEFYPLAQRERSQINMMIELMTQINNEALKVQRILIDGFNSLFAVTNGNYLEEDNYSVE